MRDDRWVDRHYFTLVDRHFFEPYAELYTPTRTYSDIVRGLTIENEWDCTLRRSGTWWHVNFRQHTPPPQGWKIHVSSTLVDATSVLQDACMVLGRRGVSFKFALDEHTHYLFNSKRWARGHSGKFMTIYPASDDQFLSLLDELASVLHGRKGPYILSDRRFRDCEVLYYRYGGIDLIEDLDLSGTRTAMIRNLEGELVPDQRLPAFRPPPWVLDPVVSEEPVAGAPSSGLAGGRFKVTAALQFSNAGGVYVGQDNRTGQKVVIKEARPHVLTDPDSSSANLLEREYGLLCLLGETGLVPRPIASFKEWEHTFIVMEYIHGRDLREWLLASHPLLSLAPTSDELKSYLAKVLQLAEELATAIGRVHSAGVILGDLSPFNVMLEDPHLRVRLIDLEASYVQGMQPTDIMTDGFRRSGGLVDVSAAKSQDWFSLGALLAFLAWPINQTMPLRKDYAVTVLPGIACDLHWPTDFVQLIQSLLSGATGEDAVDRVRKVQDAH